MSKTFTIETTKERFPVMCAGHLVLAEIVRQQKDGWIECKFICHMDSGSEGLWLDFGQNWKITRGDTFKVYKAQFERALEVIADARERTLDIDGWYKKQQAEIRKAGY